MFYVIAHRPILLMLCLVGLGFLVGVVIHRRSGDRWGYGIIIPAFVLGMVNIFTGQWLNAAFLNAAGVHGTAVVVDSRRTDALLTDKHIYTGRATRRERVCKKV